MTAAIAGYTFDITIHLSFTPAFRGTAHCLPLLVFQLLLLTPAGGVFFIVHR
jgi:hypothetical protein